MTHAHRSVRVGGGGILIAVAACWLGLTASPAPAAIISQNSSGCNPGPCTDTNYFYAGAGSESNNVLVQQIGSNYDFLESAPGTEITGFYSICSRVSPVEVTCPTTWDYGDGVVTFDVDASLNGGADQIDMRTPRPARIIGGGGSDVLKGGSSTDVILGDSDGSPA